MFFKAFRIFCLTVCVDVAIGLPGYDETYPGCPEDMIFFYAHLGLGGKLYKVEQVVKNAHAFNFFLILKNNLFKSSQTIIDKVLASFSFFLCDVGCCY